MYEELQTLVAHIEAHMLVPLHVGAKKLWAKSYGTSSEALQIS